MQLTDLVQMQEDKRDSNWESLFFHQLTQADVEVLSPEPQQGPDGWPYLMVQTKDANSTAKGESAQKIIHWLSERGIGLVVNPLKEYPDYVFTYGMLWNFRQTGLFYQTTASEVKSGPVEINRQNELHYGPPSAEYLPGHVRKILRDFFRDQGLIAVKILMISDDGKNFDLGISLESLGNPPEKEHQGIAEAIGWFLPSHYSILIVSERGLPAFHDL